MMHLELLADVLLVEVQNGQIDREAGFLVCLCLIFFFKKIKKREKPANPQVIRGMKQESSSLCFLGRSKLSCPNESDPV